MAVTRPWITPASIKAYSSDVAIKGKTRTKKDSSGNDPTITVIPERTNEKIAVDITRAEAMIIKYCHHDFSDTEKYPELPENVRVAAILLAEAIAHNDYVSTVAYSNYKSESMDDYSYTAGDATAVSISGLGLASLLDEYVTSQAKGGVLLRMRRL